MPRNTRLPGHELRNEGAPFAWSSGRYVRQRETWTGKGLCSCGAVSDVLDSNNARKRWHRAHKDEMRQSGGDRG
ncbi:hypothetical protein AB0C10_37060 [Microbispora amethystogenes]|uniref:hypothetical protein n=1 Tax=Microbispora amethystogenes TaxID=1427754 RepID=UPI0033CDCB88